MNKKFERIIERIIERIMIIKINIVFIIIFCGGIMYSAEMLGNAISLKEIFFWTSITLILAFQMSQSISRILNKIQEFITNSYKKSGVKK